MSRQTKIADPVFILTGSSHQYTEARRKLDLIPVQAFWLTRGAFLQGKQHPKVYRFGDWKSLPKIEEIEAAMAAAQAEIVDL